MDNWSRTSFKKPLYNSLSFLVVYGNFDVDFKINKSYNVTGIQEGIEIMHYDSLTQLEVLETFKNGYTWDELSNNNPKLKADIDSAKECYIIKGETVDLNNLNDLRNIIGITSYLIDNGGVAVYDLQTLTFWNAKEWDTQIFKSQNNELSRQVLILFSEDDDGKWYHTRGMRKFGRPDLSIHNVPKEYEKDIIDLINSFISLQILGEIIETGRQINSDTLPEGMRCENLGDFEDLDFNNKHIEIHWK